MARTGGQQLASRVIWCLLLHQLTVKAQLRVTLVNDIPSHFEVLAGVMEVFRQMQVQPTVIYTGNPNILDAIGFKTWMSQVPVSYEHFSTYSKGPQSDLVICISAEMAPQVCKDVLLDLRPRVFVAYIHRADTATPTSKVKTLHYQYKLLALAPHVASLASQRLKQPVDWALPVAPYLPTTCQDRKCLKGFSIQGSLRKFKSKKAAGFTRNYTNLWDRLLDVKNSGAGPPGGLRVVVVGRGRREDLDIPSVLEQDVDFYARLPYEEFWSKISRTLALVPAFGMPVYYESRISSTITASLTTGVPVIADRKLLKTYTFLTEEHVFLRREGEDEVAAMVRISRMPAEEIYRRRRALATLRDHMNARSVDFYRTTIAQAQV